MLRTIMWIIYFIFRLLIVTPDLFRVKFLDKKNRIEERDKLVAKTAKKWGRDLVNASGSKVNVIGEENVPKDQAVLFVSNHQSNLDIPILLGFIDKPKAFIAKVELNKFPIFSTWMRYAKCIFINRGHPRDALKAINEGAKLLKEGYSFVLFPEGTRSKDGSLGRFKPGSLKMATKSGVPVVPVTIRGANEIMPTNKMVIRPAKVEVIISKPIFMEEDIHKDSNALNQKLWNIINENLNKQL